MKWTTWTLLFSIMLLISRNEASATADVDISLEFAQTPEELSWGLMDRDHLDDNTGMLLIFKDPAPISTWMYNTYINLSVAFLDKDSKIREIHHMYAFPDKMKRRIKPQELNQMSFTDPAVAFFIRRQVSTSFPAKYALEVNLGWFEKKHVSIGDTLIWRPGQTEAKIVAREIQD